MADRTSFSLRPRHDAKPLDAKIAQRIGRIVRADVVELGEAAARRSDSTPRATPRPCAVT